MRTFKASPLRIIVRSVTKLFKKTLKIRKKHPSTNSINFPKFIKKKDRRDFFFVRKEGVRIFDDCISFEGFNIRKHNQIATKKHNIPHDKQYNYCEPHIRRGGDGRWWFSCLIKYDEPIKVNYNKMSSEPIGIDLGVKTFVTLSDGTKLDYPKKKLAKIEKVRRRKQRRLTRYQQRILKEAKRTKTKYENIPKSKNMQKLEVSLQKTHTRLQNIRKNTRIDIVNKIIKRNPSAIVMEGLNVTGMMNFRSLSKRILDNGFYQLRTLVKYKCEWNDIRFIEADRWFPSSKKCSCCGSIKKDLTLKDRVYECPVCGLEIDRDINAALNLKNLALIDTP